MRKYCFTKNPGEFCRRRLGRELSMCGGKKLISGGVEKKNGKNNNKRLVMYNPVNYVPSSLAANFIPPVFLINPRHYL